MPVDPSIPLPDLLPVLASLLADVALDAPVAVGLRLVPANRRQDPAGRPGAPVHLLDREVELFFRHLDCTDAVGALCGFIAPDDWHAFGVVAPGQSYRVGPDGTPGPNPATAVIACALVDRSGRVVSEVRTTHGDLVADGATHGRVVDACRRSLGLGTAPALAPPLAWATILWVDAVLAKVLGADLGRAPTWDELHRLDPFDGLDLPRALAWSDLRTACAMQLFDVPGIAPSAAGWMDDGMFAREAVAVLAPLIEMLTDLRELLPPEVFDRVVARVSAQLGE